MGKRIATPTRTFGPIHFEDLEPHRFEDLVRQLAYDFRTWQSLDATGRLGADGGLDIRGIALSRIPEDGLVQPATDVEDVDEPALDLDQREWRIQCKRYKQIGATLMREIVRDTVPSAGSPPYGLVVAAACDVSARTMAAFRDEAVKRNVREAHLWTKARLEDMLFQPEHDHLLFAYFGISLGTRRRSQLQKVRARIALKRKLLRALEWESMDGGNPATVLIRDLLDEGYPAYSTIPGFTEMRVPPWHMGRIVQSHPHGVWVCRATADGWVREDRTWDLLKETVQDMWYLGTDQQFWGDLRKEPKPYEERQRIRDQVPERERRSIELWRFLPFDNLMEIDPFGDQIHTGPHLFCRFAHADTGPYDPGVLTVARREYPFNDGEILKPEARTSLYQKLSSLEGGSAS